MRDIRLGDDIDDFCVRCKRVMNHNVVSVLNNAPAKVRCRICHSDHDFRNEQPPPPKVDLRKQALFNEVLQKVAGGGAPAVDDPELVIAAAAEVDLEAEVEPEAEIEIEIEEPVEPFEPAKPAKPAAVKKTPKAKAKPRGRPRK
jgi:hypothetical protein